MDQVDEAEGWGSVSMALFIYNTNKYKGGWPIFPCGSQLQDLYEESESWSEDLPVLAARPDGRIWQSSIKTLLPYPFGMRDLGIVPGNQ